MSQLLHQKHLKNHISFGEWINGRALYSSLCNVSLNAHIRRSPLGPVTFPARRASMRVAKQSKFSASSGGINPVRRSSQTHLCFDKTRAIRMLGLFGRERLHEPACVSWLQTTMKLNYVGTAMTNRRAPFRRQTEKVCGCPETLVVPRSELLRPLSGSYA